jgi:hypothetical protein
MSITLSHILKLFSLLIKKIDKQSALPSSGCDDAGNSSDLNGKMVAVDGFLAEMRLDVELRLATHLPCLFLMGEDMLHEVGGVVDIRGSPHHPST